MKLSETFHLGLCMAGSITAGAYTAGVMDYLIETLEAWEKIKTEEDVPDHQVVIDLLCGSSGGGMTGAMALFALMDKMDHARLEPDGITYHIPKNNILWKTWVELDQGDMLENLLATNDIQSQKVSSVLNSNFIDNLAKELEKYIDALPKDLTPPPFFGRAPEMFMTLFNVTGINYELHSRSTNGTDNQYVSDHRDIAHFRWTDAVYLAGKPHVDATTKKIVNTDCDGRIPISLKNPEFIKILIGAAKATGAFPVGLKARLVDRPAKFIWDNPFFNKDGRFSQSTISLGKNVTDRDSTYTSLNSDGGTANNEPVELARNILLNMRDKVYRDLSLKGKDVVEMDDAEKAAAVKEKLVNTSILLIDPFPSLTNDIKIPDNNTGNYPAYARSIIKAMNSQLIFDAKDALDAYRKQNYGLHIISPSRDQVEANHAIACGSLAGFGGFLNREFRVHDFFLGRKNCQSFLRKYFVARLDEPDPESRACIQSVINAYQKRPKAKERFSFNDEDGIRWTPIIPDVSLLRPVEFTQANGSINFSEGDKLPLYKLKKLPADFLEKYHPAIDKRFIAIANNLIAGNWFQKLIIRLYTGFKKKKVTAWLSREIYEDLLERKLVEQNS